MSGGSPSAPAPDLGLLAARVMQPTSEAARRACLSSQRQDVACCYMANTAHSQMQMQMQMQMQRTVCTRGRCVGVPKISGQQRKASQRRVWAQFVSEESPATFPLGCGVSGGGSWAADRRSSRLTPVGSRRAVLLRRLISGRAVGARGRSCRHRACPNELGLRWAPGASARA